MNGIKRFWSRRNAYVNLGDDGYLVDPESEYGSLFNPDVETVNFLSDAPCLVLLGEPGIGKSFTMAAARDAVHNQIVGQGDQNLWVDLHEVGSEQQLNRRIFDTDAYQRWREGSGKLYLFLDSFDECRVQVSTLSPLLLSELRQCDSSRLNLRIACRTADWPPTLEYGLGDVFGPEQVDVRELLPLRRIDVRSLAQEAGVLDRDAFLRAISDADVTPFAIKPTTLNFLINTFVRNEALPSRQVDLYGEGCRLLCEETERRLELAFRTELSARQRLTVARRIAGLTVFTNRAAVWTDVDHGDVPRDDITIAGLSGDVERQPEGPITVDENAVRETLDTGLFSSRGQRRLGFSHRTYAEFLAADYLIGRELTLPQLMSLIVHPGDPEGRIVPQLHEVAAWLASMDDRVYDEIRTRDPEVLLRSDVASATNESRAALVNALLEAYDSGNLVDDDLSLRRRYARLNHPSLAAQLRVYIVDSSKGHVVRRVAMGLAEQCQITSLVDDLVGVTLDSREDQSNRVSAAYTIIGIGNPEARARLRELLSVDPADDPDDELKGCGLLATWPDILSTEELLTALTPLRGHLLGAYRRFLHRDFSQDLKTLDLVLALRWARQQIEATPIPFEFEEMIGRFMRRAWEHLDEPDVLPEVAQISLLHVRKLGGLFQGHGIEEGDQALLDQVERRRQVIESMLGGITDYSELRLLVWAGLVQHRDMPWILEQLANSHTEAKRAWAELVFAALEVHNRAMIERVLQAREDDEVLGKVLAPLFDAVPYKGAEADRAREIYRLEQELKTRREVEAPLPDPPPAKRVRNDLDRIDAGDLDAFWRLNYDLRLENVAHQSVHEFESDLTALPGWQEADELTRARIVAAAGQYVAEQAPKEEEWIDHFPQVQNYRPDWAAFRAFRLLLDQKTESLDQLPSEVWTRWAVVITAFPTLSSSEAIEAQTQLISRAYEHAPDGVTATLFKLLDREAAREPASLEGLLRRVARSWDEPLGTALLGHVRLSNYAPRALHDALEELFSHRVSGTKEYAKDLLIQREQNQDSAAVAAAALLRYTALEGWKDVWNIVVEEESFGELVLGWVVHDDRYKGSIVYHLSEIKLAEAFVALSKRYPQAEDLLPNGAVTFRHSVADWRDSLLWTLEYRGTIESCTAIQQIMEALPHLEWLRWTLLSARRITRQRSWQPPTVDDIRSLCQSHERRLIQSPDALLNVVMESLDRFQNRLQLSEPPLVPYLWEEYAKRPKDEESLSDLVTMHFDQDIRERGIVANREVVNRRGDETDIRVETFLYDEEGKPVDLMAVVVEVKGNWNRELRQAMSTQLVDRYMANNHTNHGVYVVGWYEWSEWDSQDWRRGRVPKYGIDEARRRFDEQAVSLTDVTRTVRAVVLDTRHR